MDTPQREVDDGPPPHAVVMQMALGALVSQALGVAAKLKFADAIGDGSKTAGEIAAAAGAHEGSVYRIMRTLASAGVFSEVGERRFENTAASDVLRSDSPGSMRDVAVFMAEPWHFKGWGQMEHSVLTGESAWKKAFGEEIFEWFGNNPDAASTFNSAMTCLSRSAAPAVVEAYDFSRIGALADIAGGHGFLLSQILKANPGLKGILFDMDSVIAGSGDLLEREGVADRVQTVGGDFFKEVPAADGYILRHIIHDWDDGRCVKILQNIHRAMTGGGPLLIIEMIVPEGNDPHPSKILDLEMLTLPGGLERTEKEFALLLDSAGFRLNRIVPTRSAHSVIEAFKA